MSTLYYHIFYFKKIEVLDLAAHFSLERSPIKNRINRSNKGAAHMEAGILPRHSGKTAARSGDCFLAHCNRSDTDPQFCTQNQIEAQRKRVRFGRKEQESGQMMSFCSVRVKRRRSKANFAPTCSDSKK